MKRNDLIKAELAATLKRMSATRAVNTITVSALAAECQISRGTFYNHFMDIYDLINWIFERDIIEPLKKHIEANSKAGWHGITGYCLRKLYEDKTFYCSAFSMNGQNCLKDYVKGRNLECWRLLIEKYMKEYGKSCDRELLRYMLEFTSQSICSYVISWAENGMETSVEIMEKMDDFATKGIYGMLE